MFRTLILSALALLLLGSPVRANPLRVCLIGCEAPTEAAPEVRLNPVLYMGPALSITAVERDAINRKLTLGVALGAGYGLKWRPRAWLFEGPALAIDLYARFSVEDTTARLDLLPMVTLGNLITAGVGLRCEMAEAGDRCGYLVAVGAGVSL